MSASRSRGAGGIASHFCPEFAIAEAVLVREVFFFSLISIVWVASVSTRGPPAREFALLGLDFVVSL